MQSIVYQCVCNEEANLEPCKQGKNVEHWGPPVVFHLLFTFKRKQWYKEHNIYVLCIACDLFLWAYSSLNQVCLHWTQW